MLEIPKTVIIACEGTACNMQQAIHIMWITTPSKWMFCDIEQFLPFEARIHNVSIKICDWLFQLKYFSLEYLNSFYRFPVLEINKETTEQETLEDIINDNVYYETVINCLSGERIGNTKCHCLQFIAAKSDNYY